MDSVRQTWGRLSRILARDKDTIKNQEPPQTWKYVENNIRHWRWFWCRNPMRVLKDLWWWVKHRTIKRFHVLKLRGLTPGWWDTDTRLLFASFTLLEDYVEREKPFKIVEWNDDDTSRDYANEIHSLYLWWKRRKACHNDSISIEEEDKRYTEETENLLRLMKIRGVLWT